MTARRRAERQDVVTAPEIGVGLKRMGDPSIAGSGLSVVERIHRLARRGKTRLARVQDFSALPQPLKLQHNLHASVLNVIANRSGSHSLKKLEAKITADGVLPLAKCLEAMKETL
jgi:hypothetical protein